MPGFFGAVDRLPDALDIAGGVWSLSPKTGTYCGLPLVPVATGGFGAHVLELPEGVRCWGWTPPGEFAAADRYGQALIADVELARTNKAKPSAGWTGTELAQAEALAPRVGGVTSHGFVLRQLRGVLGAFAAAGCTAYPQVYDTDRSTEPRSFLRRCVAMYLEAGFKNVVPLLGVAAGPDHLVAWLDECARMQIRPDLWQLSRLREIKACDNGHKAQPGNRPLPAPGPLPGPPPISLSPRPVGDLALLLAAVFFLYSQRRRRKP